MTGLICFLPVRTQLIGPLPALPSSCFATPWKLTSGAANCDGGYLCAAQPLPVATLHLATGSERPGTGACQQRQPPGNKEDCNGDIPT